MDYNKELQLLPGTKKRLGIKVPGENRFLYVGSAILGAVLITVFYLNNYINRLTSEVGDLNRQLAALEQRRDKKNEEELRLNKDRLTLVSDLVKNHVYWTEALVWLENMLQGNIQVQNASFETDKLLITGVATDYTAVARQIAAFLTDPRVIDLSVSSLESQSIGQIEFSMSLVLDIANLITKK